MVNATILVEPDPADRRPRPPRSAWLVRPTANGRRAQEVWRPLFGLIEERWQARFGSDEIRRLRESLSALVRRLDIELPDYLPVLGYGLRAEVPGRQGRVRAAGADAGAPPLALSALLAKVLLAFTLDFERESDLSLAMGANVTRLVGDTGVRLRDLPRLAGVSKEAIKVAVGFLEKRGYAVIEPAPAASRSKLVRFTAKGREAREAYCRWPGVIEERWQAKFGRADVRNQDRRPGSLAFASGRRGRLRVAI